ncbi:MAG: hypothetical protein E6R00_04905 [Gammaproteobacteria bacterium]|nr:MAG: hypothetical protein E6R00_04905 [Gammaproteobacteria bacterium]
MSIDRNGGKQNDGNTRRGIKLAPMTRAVRSALAVSAMALGLGAAGTAMAAAQQVPVAQVLQTQRAAIDFAPVHDLTVVDALFAPLAIAVTDAGDVAIDNVDPIVVSDPLYSVVAISGYSTGGNVDITNAAGADLTAASGYGDAIGIYGYSATGDVAIDNAADIDVYSGLGLADGIFASGANVEIANSGAISVDGYTWAAGIEAQAVDVVNVANTGDITASVYSNGHAYGIYATGSDVTVVNEGNVGVQGYYATGIEAQSYGDIAIDNGGSIVAYSGNGLALGINASSGGEGAVVSVGNTGVVAAVGYYGGTAISAVSSGVGGTVSVDNSGTLYAQQGNKYGLGAYGISTSADSDSAVTNSGTITVVSEGAATGISSISFAGNASVSNSGDVDVTSNAAISYVANGLVAFSANGSASVDNSGNVIVSGKYVGTAIDASAYGDVVVDNSGMLYANGDKYAYGVRAISNGGDVAVTNADTGSIGFNSYYGRGFGVLGIAYTGDVSVTNAGTIAGYAYGQAVGVFAFASAGNVTVENSGTISTDSVGASVGVFARADVGVAAIDNSGSVEAYSSDSVAYGLFARADYGMAVASNSGSIYSVGLLASTGIYAVGYYGASITTTGGSIDVLTAGTAAGVHARSYLGDAVVDNASDIQVIGVQQGGSGILATAGYGNVSVANTGRISALSMMGDVNGITGYSIAGDVVIENHGDVLTYSYGGNAIGLYGYSEYANAAITNTGAIYAASYYGLADAIFASGMGVSVTNEGQLDAIGDTWAAGIEAQGTDVAVVSNSGDINATATMFGQVVDSYGYTVAYGNGGTGFGIYVTAGTGGASVGNSGNLAVNGGYATGIQVQSYGDILVSNSGDIAAGVGLHQEYLGYGYTLYYGTQLATGIAANSSGEAASVQVGNEGNIVADGVFGAYGISAVSSGIYGTVTVANGGSIQAQQANKYGVGAYGVFVSADSDGTIGNTGTITVDSAGMATGAAALSFAGDALIVNAGDIAVTSSAQAKYGATGVTAFAGNGEATVSNSGSISASSDSLYGASTRAIDAQGQQGATVYNSGVVYASGKYAYGVYASSAGGDVVVRNAEDGEIGFYSFYSRGFGVLGIAYSGDVAVLNEGTIEGYAYGQSVGVFGFAAVGDASTSNSGDITVTSGNGTAVGVFDRADYGTATVVNSGDITVKSGTDIYPGALAYGVVARGSYAQVGNSGDITAIGYLSAAGIKASSIYGTLVSTTGGTISAGAAGSAIGIYASSTQGDVTVVNASEITAAGAVYGAAGIQAISAGGDVTVGNTASIYAASLYENALAMNVTAYGDITIQNQGDLKATVMGGYGVAFGINAMDLGVNYVYQTGTINIVNTGDIDLLSLSPAWGKAYGIRAIRENGDVLVQNAGDITSYAGGRAYGVYAQSKYGNVEIVNTGNITMASPYDAAIGLNASTGTFFYGGGDASIKNGGDITIDTTYGIAVGMQAIAGSVQNPYGDAYILNTGDITLTANYMGYAVQARATDGDTTIINTGDISVTTSAYFNYVTPGTAAGISGLNMVDGQMLIQNTGDLDIHGYVLAYGVYGKATYLGDVTLVNGGDISVSSDIGIGRGMMGYSIYGDVTVNNAAGGTVDVSGGTAAVGVQTVVFFGDAVINNAGTIHAGGSDHAAAVLFDSLYGSNTLNNFATGVISATGPAASTQAVVGGHTAETINNAGKILGSVLLYSGDDVFNNVSGGVWDVGTSAYADFGDGDDKLVNAGTVKVGAGGVISFGDGNDNVFNQPGGVFDLAGGTIDMGAGSNVFTNAGVVKATAAGNHINVGAGGTINNVNTFQFINGATSDRLALTGTLTGNGALNIDVNLANSTADQLLVNGNMGATSAQVVNIAFPGMPLTAHTSAVFANVTGTSAAGNFVAGQIFGYNHAANFLDLGLTVSSQINAANTANDVFSINVDVNGLNDTGALAASASSGAAVFLNSQVGTFRQRLGFNPYGDAGKVMSAFVRYYTSNGDLRQAHTAANFGQGGNFNFDQSSWGTEVGVNANLFGNFHAGLVLGQADSRQRLIDGYGTSRMDGKTVGGYATWYAPGGLYVDLSTRQMAMDIFATSAAGVLQSRAHAKAHSIEAGYEVEIGGFNLVPQLQYTRTEVEGIRDFIGNRANFESHGGTFSRTRLGLEFNKTMDINGVRWTPYGSVNAIRESDGASTYTVATNFHGTTSLKGSSGMAEIGLSVEKGGFGFNLGANWTDGGAYKSFAGAQANVRFSW